MKGRKLEPCPADAVTDFRAMTERDTMEKKIRRATDLPSWFDLKKYSQAAALDAAGWYEQLSVRKRLLEMLAWREENKEPLNDRDLETLTSIRTMPIVDVTASFDMRVRFYDGVMHELQTEEPRYSLGVRLSTVRDFFLVERRIESEKRKYAHQFFSQLDDSDWLNGSDEVRLPFTDWIDGPIDAISKPPASTMNVRVDLALPDKVLVEQFKALLQSLRKAHYEAGSDFATNRRQNFADWVSFGVLPFIDLTTWERETGSKIPNRVMADAIFSLGEGGEDVVRKTTSKIAKELMTDGSLKFLAAVAGQQISEASSG
jgi:hypothetical protein